MKEFLKKIPIWYTLLSCFGVLALLLFIAYSDEDYNNWSWTQDAGSWVFMFIAWNVLFWFLCGVGYAINKVPKG